MKPSRIVLLLIALLAGGLAAFLATRGNSTAPVTTAQSTATIAVKNKVLVAKADIGVGQRLSAAVLDWQEWPQDGTADYITISAMPDALTQMNGAVARFEFFKGDPIREQKLARSDQGFLSAVLTPGMRGVSLPVAAASGAGGFIVPNDRVDLVQSSSSGNGQAVSRTILSDVKVLAIGARLGQVGTTGAPPDPTDPKSQMFTADTIATLELTPTQSEVVINAAQQGKISLVLRSVADFAQKSDGLQKMRGSQSIRVIRFGKSSELQGGGAESPASSSASIDPATLAAAPAVNVEVGPAAPVPPPPVPQ
ncbi:MAG: cpaB [Hyphomicrobiales bacterium]|nr:cpaB [Hyphomicrobiales bacterium]